MTEELKLREDGGIDDTMTATVDHGGRISIEVDNAWAGDTETGIGRSAAVRLTKDQALELADWLIKAAACLPSPLKGR